MTTPHPGYPINYRCYDFNQDPLFIKLTTDYPGDWTPHKQGYRVKWGKVTAYVYRTGSDEEICVEMVYVKNTYKHTANKLWYVDDVFESCVLSVERDLRNWCNDWLTRLHVFKDCPPKIRSHLASVMLDVRPCQDTITQLKEQLKVEQKTIRQLNKLKGVLGL